MPKTIQFIILIIALFAIPLSAQSWVQTNGPNTSSISKILVEKNDNLYAGARIGFYKSTDRAQQWLKTSNQWIDGFHTAAVSANGNIFVGTGISILLEDIYIQVDRLYSTDNGTSWDTVAIGGFENPVNVFSADTLGNVFAITIPDYTTFRSTDNGITWDTLSDVSGLGSIQTNASGTVVGIWGYSQNLVYSTDSGENWTSQPYDFGDTTITAISIDDNNVLYAYSYTHYALFRSSDFGQSWQTLDVNVSLTYGKPHIAAKDENTVYLGCDTGLYESTDGGVTWALMALDGYNIQDLNVDSEGNLYVGTHYGLYKITESKKIIRANNGFYDVYVEKLGSSGDTLVAGAFSLGLTISPDGGNSWDFRRGSIDIRNILRVESGRCFIAAGNRSVYTHDFETFTDLGKDFEAMAENKNTGRIFGDNFYSDDNGETWTQSTLTDNDIVSMEIDPNGYIYAGTRNNGIYRSKDNGETWKHVYTSGLIREIVIDENANVHMIKGGELYRSTDYGASWDTLHSITEPLIYLAKKGAAIYTGYDKTVYLSTDNGSSWDSFMDGLPTESPRIQDVHVHTDGRVYLSTYYNGVYVSDVPVSVEDNTVPRKFLLEQNYPNPFNPATTIRYSIPEAAFVTLKIYNVLGQEVAQLVNKEMAGGNYEVEFNAANLTSGIYFYSINAGDYSAVKKMMLLK